MVKKFKINYNFKGGMNKNNQDKSDLNKVGKKEKVEEYKNKREGMKELEEELDKKLKMERKIRLNNIDKEINIEIEQDLEKGLEEELQEGLQENMLKELEEELQEDLQENMLKELEEKTKELEEKTKINRIILKSNINLKFNKNTNNEIDFQRNIINELKKNGISITEYVILNYVKPMVEFLIGATYDRNDQSLDGLEDLIDSSDKR